MSKLQIKKCGYDGVEWRVHDEGHFTLQELDEKTEQIRKMTESYDLEIVSLISYLQVQDIKNIEKLFGATEKIGCSQARLWPPPYEGKIDYYQLYNRGLKAMEKVDKLAEKYNLRVTFEIHGRTIMPSAGLAYRWVSNFSPNRVGIIFDPGNMVGEGMENWKMGLEILGNYLAYVHCKNTGWFREKGQENKGWHWEWVGLNEGTVDWKEIIGILKQRGYDGYLSNEDFREIPPSKKLKENIEHLRTVVQKVS